MLYTPALLCCSSISTILYGEEVKLNRVWNVWAIFSGHTGYSKLILFWNATSSTIVLEPNIGWSKMSLLVSQCVESMDLSYYKADLHQVSKA